MSRIGKYKLSFRIFHPSMRAEDIAEKIGLKSKHLHSLGAARQTPKGTKLDGVYSQTYVSFDLEEYEGEILEDALRRALEEKLASKMPYLSELVATGGVLEFFVGIFLEGNEGLQIDAELIDLFASAKIGLSLDIYP